MTSQYNRIWTFSGTVLPISWLLAGLFYLLGGRMGNLGGMAFAAGYMFLPGLGGLALAHWRDGSDDLRRTLGLKVDTWKSPAWALAWLLPVAYTALALGASLLVPTTEFSADGAALLQRYRDIWSPERIADAERALQELPFHVGWIALLQGLIAGPTINALFALGEEAGWRGYLYHHGRSLGFWTYSLLVGTLWGLWHTPLILMGHNYPDHPVAGLGMMVLYCLALSPLFTYLTDTLGNAYGAAILHGTNNALAGMPLLFVVGGSNLVIGVTGLAGIASIALLSLGVALVRIVETPEPKG